jgi:hypothetical protein
MAQAATGAMSRKYDSIPAVEVFNDKAPIEDVRVQNNQRSKIVISLICALAVLGYGGSKSIRGQQVQSMPSDNVYQSNDAEILGSPKKSFLLDDSLDATPLWYDQFLDHIGEDTEHHGDALETYQQRYLKKSKHWKGPGHPILVVMGGEGSLDPPMLYQFVHDGLAEEFGAFVLSPEHRFYGESQPLKNATVEELMKYLTPEQALADAVNLIQFVQEELGCSRTRTSKNYCPVISFGGSYPGFLSFMLRFVYPDYVDIGYASSAPLDLYSQVVNSDEYFDKVTEVADIASAGCADAVRSTVYAVRDELLANYTSVLEAAAAAGICTDTFPAYIKDVPEFVSEIVIYFVPAIFADLNMGYYPPGPETGLTKACHIFQETDKLPMERLANFFHLRGDLEFDSSDQCLDLAKELPSGPNAHIRGSDNSGTGGGPIGEMWEFQCCKDLIIRSGYSPESMFLPRHFSYDWHKMHCYERFPGIRVEPFRMAMEWGFNDLSRTSRLLFANGLHDGWSTSSILKEDNPNNFIINFPNGAHHSELGRHYPNPMDTEDIIEGHETVKKVLGDWLKEIYLERDH